jgi:hypothetical protein
MPGSAASNRVIRSSTIAIISFIISSRRTALFATMASFTIFMVTLQAKGSSQSL